MKGKLRSLFRDTSTNLNVESTIVWRSESGALRSYVADSFIPLKSPQDIWKIYDSVSKSIESSKPRNTDDIIKPVLQLVISLNGKIRGETYHREFETMEAFHQFLIDKNLIEAPAPAPSLTK